MANIPSGTELARPFVPAKDLALSKRFYARLLLATTALVWAATVGAAQAQIVARLPGEADLPFAQRVLHVSAENQPHVVSAPWNGVPTLFVDYIATSSDGTSVPLVALMHQSDDRYRVVNVTIGDEEGATATLAAIGFAEADHSGAKALITIFTWDTHHQGSVEGTLYEVRLFASPAPGQDQLTPMTIGSHFGVGCECWHGDGPPEHPESRTHYKFKTIADVKRELKRLGY